LALDELAVLMIGSLIAFWAVPDMSVGRYLERTPRFVPRLAGKPGDRAQKYLSRPG
jgi:hypothetical protein